MPRKRNHTEMRQPVNSSTRGSQKATKQQSTRRRTKSPNAQEIKSSYTKLEPIRVIGSGSFGYVFEAYDKESKRKVAVKRT